MAKIFPIIVMKALALPQGWRKPAARQMSPSPENVDRLLVDPDRRAAKDVLPPKGSPVKGE